MGIRSLSTASISTGTKRSKVWDQSAVVNNNSYESIATINVTSNTNSVTFSSIPSGYKHLQIRGIARSAYSSTSAGCSQYKLQFNGDTASNYSYHQAGGTGAATFSQNAASQAQIAMNATWSNVGGYGSVVYVPVIVDIIDYKNTSKNKTVRIVEGFEGNQASNNQYIMQRSAAWYSTSAITSITLDSTPGYADGSFASGTQFALYGIKE